MYSIIKGLIAIFFFAANAMAQTITSVEPDSAYQGESLTVTITGQNTKFTTGSGTVHLSSFDDITSISATNFTVIHDSLLDADFNIPFDASTGFWNLNAPDELVGFVRLDSGFTIYTTSPGIPIITSVEPDSAYRGESLTVAIKGRNTTFSQGDSILHVLLSFTGGSDEINSTIYNIVSDTLLNADFDIPSDASTGFWNVLTEDIFGGILTLDSGFTIYDSTIGIELESDQNIPGAFGLSQNFPNPFNPVTTIKYALPFSAEVLLTIYNLSGEEVARLVSSNQSAGHQHVIWDASNVSSGFYFYRLQAGDFIQTKKMVLLK